MPGNKESFVVVGAGRVGTAVARALRDAGYPCLALFGRNPERVGAAGRFVGVEGHTVPKPEIIKQAGVVFVAVPDDAIRETAAGLGDRGAIAPSHVLIHFSGLVTSEAFLPAGRAARGRASAHPNMAFADPATAASKIPGTYFGVEGDGEGTLAAEAMVKDMGGIPVRIPLEGKVAYHLAAVFASNGMVVLSSIAGDILRDIGVGRQEAEKITARLQLGTAQNIGELGILRALTGPVVRGDTKTVAAHLGAMEAMPAEWREVYCLLFKKMVALGVEAGRGTPEKYRPIMDLLDSDLTNFTK
jgi:predicted short-subunit dehydrogenase-like oxidoreductase (DUF2520 family)